MFPGSKNCSPARKYLFFFNISFKNEILIIHKPSQLCDHIRPDRFSSFDVFWKQLTNGQTPKQAKNIQIDISYNNLKSKTLANFK